MLKNNKMMIVLIFLFLCPVHLFASDLLYGENFDDKDIDQPYKGTLSILYGISNPAYLNQHYEIVSPGRNGSGYSFRSMPGAGHDSHGFWNFGDTWPSDELYVSMWIKMPNVENPINFDNLKLFYPHWNGTKSYVHYGITQTGQTLYFSAHDKNGDVLDQSVYISGVTPADGNWHKYAWWIKFSTGQHRFWYDGTLKLDKNYRDGCWTNNVYHIKFAGYDANGTDGFLWQLDDIEVWDGMPGSVASSPVDSGPSITIQSPTQQATHNTSVNTISLQGVSSDDKGIASISWASSNNQQGIISGSLSNWDTGAIDLQTGANQITVTATDTGGNTASDTITVNYDPDGSLKIWDGATQTGDSSWSDSSAAWCVRALIEGSAISQTGDGIQIGIMGRSSSTYRVKEVSIAEADPSGGQGAVVDSTWTPVTFDQKSVSNWSTDYTTIPADSEKLSDPIDFSVDPSKDYYITLTMESPSVYVFAPSGYQELYFEGSDHSGDIDWTDNGCSTYNGRLHAISSIYVSSNKLFAPTGLKVQSASNP